ncbi:MAG: adenine phosphoribosyltransferase [Candidatus Latescibacteria bacterium]|nr:adenine phosphoribosyltransferase [bacterium]MBD3423667.1 adenine phosphoribosyltransferase [Candidatus Latescibacterota bacterium]
MIDIRKAIRDIPDFPKEGILFRDITPALLSPEVFSEICDRIYQRYRDRNIDKVAAVESRGFIFGSVLAYRMEVGLIPVRKEGKLPYETVSESYALEYAEATLEIHTDAIDKGDRIVIIDDLLATGGTAAATCRLVESLGGKIEELFFLIELANLRGRDLLDGREIFSLITY